jgi:hypothetical protein
MLGECAARVPEDKTIVAYGNAEVAVANLRHDLAEMGVGQRFFDLLDVGRSKNV